MDRAAFASTEPAWWLVDSGAASDIASLRKELEQSPQLGAEWYLSASKLEHLYDMLGDSGLLGDELDAATDADKQRSWLERAVAAAKAKQPAPAASAQHAEAAPEAAHDASPEVPEAPPLTADEIASIAGEIGFDPKELEELLEGVNIDDIIAGAEDVEPSEGEEAEPEE